MQYYGLCYKCTYMYIVLKCFGCKKENWILFYIEINTHILFVLINCRNCTELFQSCHKYHTSGPISRDADGLDEQCRWCSEGGKLFGCDFCHNAFCKTCIIRNLGRSEISNVTEDGIVIIQNAYFISILMNYFYYTYLSKSIKW